MAFINPGIVEAAGLVARQAVSSLVSTAITASPSPTTASNPSSASNTSTPSETTVNGGPGSPGGNNNQQGSQTSQSSPLLFFVALGFGVVFTNLWIIVGVKYCFRYNARNRALRANEDGEPVALENMPRPHRRRREKKLMTMDEVNEKFPMQKYKNWVASRAQEGLPTRGGVSVPPSRANSVRSAHGIVPEIPSKERESTDERPTTRGTANDNKEKSQKSKHEAKQSTSGSTMAEVTETTAETTNLSTEATQTATTEPAAAGAEARKVTSHTSDDNGSFDDDDEHINAALPPELLGTSGDTCAICIDALEDDDDVRGLTCGHAFHAVCLDPWLTSRRACCPLCKADYYTPKPRPPPPEGSPEGTAGVVAVTLPDSGRRLNMPSRPSHAWLSFRSHGRLRGPRIPSASNAIQPQQSRPDEVAPTPAQQPGESGGQSRGGLFGRLRSGPGTAATTSQQQTASPSRSGQPESGGFFRNLRQQYVPFRQQARMAGASSNGASNGEAAGGADAPMASGANPQVTPSQLEAGVAPAR